MILLNGIFCFFALGELFLLIWQNYKASKKIRLLKSEIDYKQSIINFYSSEKNNKRFWEEIERYRKLDNTKEYDLLRERYAKLDAICKQMQREARDKAYSRYNCTEALNSEIT